MHAHGRRGMPLLEHSHLRHPTLGFEPSEDCGVLRCLDHGLPSPLIRWHYHDEYELHLIVATTGRAFVGDYIGNFSPGHLVLTGPRLPHNWISNGALAEGVVLRDRVILFRHEPVEIAAEQILEFREILPMLERARRGIEFFIELSLAQEYFERIRTSRGLQRFAIFCELLSLLAKSSDSRLLSNLAPINVNDDVPCDQTSAIVTYINDQCQNPEFSIADVCSRFRISENRVSRLLRSSTGNTFTHFVNHLRVSRACQLLTGTERYVRTICQDVGFNNIANFNRRFLEVKGVTPSAYREQAGERLGVGHIESTVQGGRLQVDGSNTKRPA